MEQVWEKGGEQVQQEGITTTIRMDGSGGMDGWKDGVEDGREADVAVKKDEKASREEPRAIGKEANEGLEMKKNNSNGADIGKEYCSNDRDDGDQSSKEGAVKATEKSGATAQVQPQGHQHFSTYCSRERMHMDREKEEEVCASYVTNDGQPESGKMLIGLKNIFSKCLPNMPKTYIARLVFDRRHKSVVIRRKNGKVLAGITYRPFYDEKFAEIAFCAVAQSLQVSGFGSRLMNWTKYYAREKDGCEYFLTYADNAAVGYFAKQGFTKSQEMPKERWQGYIKDYDGGTLMECYIHPTLPYPTIPDMIDAQKKYLNADVRKLSNANKVYPGLDRWERDGSASPMSLEEIPGVQEAGWTADSHAASQPKIRLRIQDKLVQTSPESLKKVQLELLETIAKQEIAWPFLEPVSIEEVPDYLDLVKNPIDISTIRNLIKSGNKYITMDIFIADVQRMFKNAKIYNGQDSVYYKCAHKLSVLFQQLVSSSIVYDA